MLLLINYTFTYL